MVEALAILDGAERTSRPLSEWALGPEALKPGMVLARDLISRDGALLLAADFRLDDSLIRQIRDYAQSEKDGFVLHVRGERSSA